MQNCSPVRERACLLTYLDLLWGVGLGVLMRKLSSNIRPELFKNNRHRVVPNLAAPYARSIGESFIGVRMIAVRRNTRSDGAAKYLRNVELVASRVRTRDYN